MHSLRSQATEAECASYNDSTGIFVNPARRVQRTKRDLKLTRATAQVASDLNKTGLQPHRELPAYATMNPKYHPIRTEQGRFLG
jgi:hypothetical protein